MSTQVGQIIGKYKLTEHLGSGGMADVYKAQHQTLGRIVAIKVLHPYLAVGKDFLERFTREAKAAAGLRHPRIVQVHDFDVENGLYYMVMDFVDGGNLLEYLDTLSQSGERMPLDKIVSVLNQAAEALDFAHQQGIIHRDIKPSNILLDKSGNAYLSDFGIARIFGSSHVTASGVLIGTPTYMSPEQGRGEELTPASDIYSLGIILYEMVTGRVPFNADTPVAVIFKHIQEPLPPIKELRPGLPEQIETVIQRALKKTPVDRYSSCLELVRDLEFAAKTAPKQWIVTEEFNSNPEQKSMAQLPTVKFEEGVVTSSASQKTELIVESQDLQSSDQSEDVLVSMSGSEKVSKAFDTIPENESKITASIKSELNTSSGKTVGWRNKRLILFLAGGLLVGVIILLAVMLSTGSSSKCVTIEECLANAHELSSNGNKESSLETFDQAINMVLPEDNPRYAFLWCERGNVASEIGRLEEAIQNYDTCIAWTQGDPTLEDLRRSAMENINRLRGP